MQDKNYTNPEDRARFGYSMSGVYRAPYKSETVYIAILIGAAVAAGVSFLFVIRSMLAQTVRDDSASLSVVVLGCAVALIVFAAVLIIIFGVGIKSVKKGFLCKYSASDVAFTANIGSERRVIYYKDVVGVDFNPRIWLGKTSGYDVTVTLENSEECFAVCSDGYLSPAATPFYIIKERAELIRRSRIFEQERLSEVSNPVSRNELRQAQSGLSSALDIMEELWSETPSMPELSESDAAEPQTLASLSQLPKTEKIIDVPEMSDGGVDTNAKLIVDSNGRERCLHEVQAQGTFYLEPHSAALAVIGIITFALWGVIVFIVSSLLAFLIPLPWLLVFIITSPFAVFSILTKVRGRICSYKADFLGFYVSIKGKGNEQVLYRDVLSVDYTPTKFLGFPYGCKVDILTTYGKVSYDYMFPRFNHIIKEENLPFEVIRENIPDKNK